MEATQPQLALWKKRIEEFQASSLSKSAFCKQKSIPVHTFYYWIKRLSPKKKINKESNDVFLKLESRPLKKGLNYSFVAKMIYELGKIYDHAE